MEDSKNRSFLSIVKEKFRKFKDKMKDIFAEENYSELSKEELAELKSIEELQVALHGGRNLKITENTIEDEASMERFLKNFEKGVHGGRGTKKSKTDMQDQESIEESIDKFQQTVHGGNVVPTVKVDEKTAQETAKGKVTKKGPKVLGEA